MASVPLPMIPGASHDAHASHHASLEAELEKALWRDEIEVLFQPQYRLADDTLYGAEALARWRHPELGTIGAGELFTVAERAHCVSELSQQIFRKALGHARHWPQSLALSLNATPEELVEPRFAEKFAALVSWSQRDASSVTLEITEDVLLSDLEAAAEVTRHLTALGFRISLDDFGAGFCNFRYLKRLELYALKLDRSMVEGVARDSRDLAVLRGIVAMAKALSLHVTAEGIEGAEQRDIIAREGCDVYQGFLRAGPLTPETFLQLARG